MDVIDMPRAPEPEPTADDDQPSYVRCAACGAGVERAQRYCVECGAHRANAPDPVARYLAQTSSASRAAARRSSTRGRSAVGLGSLLLVALVPLALALGILIGHSSTATSTTPTTHTTAITHTSGAGAKPTHQVRHSTGQGYVKSQQNLPNSVSVP